MSQMKIAVMLLVLFLPNAISLAVTQLPRSHGEQTLRLAHAALDAVLETASQPFSSVFLFTDGSTSPTVVYEMSRLRASWGVGVFEVVADSQDANVTQALLSRVVGEARRLQQLSWCVTVVVVSDDPVFLATFAERSRKSGLLVWSTRLLAVTRLPRSELQDLQKAFSKTNAMMLIPDDTPLFQSHRWSIYVHLPYRSQGYKALRVASWTPQQGLILNTHLPLFPEKFLKFPHRPTLLVVAEEFPTQKAVMVDDPAAPGGKRLTFTGSVSEVLDYFARGINFSYTYTRSPDRAWGAKQKDGSWHGMLGMVSREIVEIALGPFGTTTSRAEVVDFTWPLWIDESRILGGRGRPEVDPWGFLLPLAPLVWVAILTMLLAVPSVVFLLSNLSVQTLSRQMWLKDIFSYIRVLLQQDISVPVARWWERVVLGVWMMMTLVLTRSYAGNLMSLLAVRHIPQPYHTLRDVLDDSSLVMIWQKNSFNVQYIRSVESGLFREVAAMEDFGRLLSRRLSEFPKSIETLVKRGDHVIIDVGILVRNFMAQDFSRTGRCDLYLSRGRYLAFPFAMAIPKYSPLGPVVNKRVMALTEAGLFEEWLKSSVPNSTTCLHSPKKITITTILSLTNLGCS